MSIPIPSLRQPKIIKTAEIKNLTPCKKISPTKQDFFIVTLKDGKKLVVSSDAYHGILTAGELYRCVFCESEMILDVLCKERHKTSQNHRKVIENYPHLEEYQENLTRKITAGTYYCTICNVIVLSQFLHKHLNSETHLMELKQSLTRAESYIPKTAPNIIQEYPSLPVTEKKINSLPTLPATDNKIKNQQPFFGKNKKKNKKQPLLASEKKKKN